MRNAVMRKVELGDRQLRHSSRDYSAQLRPRFCPPFKRTQLSNRSQRQLYQAAQYRQGPHQTNAGTDPRPIVTLMSDLVRRINSAQESACVNPTHRSPWSVPQKHQTVDRPPRQNRPWHSQWPPAWGAVSTAPHRPDYPPQGILVGVSRRLLVFPVSSPATRQKSHWHARSALVYQQKTTDGKLVEKICQQPLFGIDSGLNRVTNIRICQ